MIQGLAFHNISSNCGEAPRLHPVASGKPISTMTESTIHYAVHNRREKREYFHIDDLESSVLNGVSTGQTTAGRIQDVRVEVIAPEE